MTTTPGDRLRVLRKKRKLSTRALAKLSEGAFTHAYVSSLELGQSAWSRVSLTALKGFARAFNMTLDEFIQEVDGRTEVLEVGISGEKTIPIYDLVSAGNGLEGGTIVDYVDIPGHWKGEYAGYQISGDSMMPRIPPGSVIIVKLTQTVRPGQVIVCYEAEYGMLLKYFERITDDGTFVLTSFNSAYDPIYAKDPHIKGYVCEVRTRYLNGNNLSNETN